jgi:hypothetical protein
VRHRLNRGGDRALNRAIHTIATVRMRDCPTTQAYIARRTAEGKTIREIKRCLKRYIARQLYRTLTATMTPHYQHASDRLTHIQASTSTRGSHDVKEFSAPRRIDRWSDVCRARMRLSLSRSAAGFGVG